MPRSLAMYGLFVVSVLLQLSNRVSTCKAMRLRDRLIGSGCAWDNHGNISGAEHECVLRCMFDKSCAAVNYDAKEYVCRTMELPCPVVETHQDVHYQILTSKPSAGCVRWVATQDCNYPRMVKYNHALVGNSRWHAVARFMINNEMLPAKWHFFLNKTCAVQANSVHCTTVFEVLLVNEVCSLKWVYHDASRGKPLPTGAVAGTGQHCTWQWYMRRLICTWLVITTTRLEWVPATTREWRMHRKWNYWWLFKNRFQYPATEIREKNDSSDVIVKPQVFLCS